MLYLLQHGILQQNIEISKYLALKKLAILWVLEFEVFTVEKPLL